MRYISAVSLAIFLTFMISVPPAQAQDTLKIVANGTQSVPPVSTNGSGIFTLIKTEDSLTVKGTFEELAGYYTGAYIQMAEKGESGNVIYRMTASDLNEDHTSGRLKAEKNTFHVPDNIEEFYRDNMLYINVASNPHPDGEIRGQIMTP
jgi:hypothetical protein